MVSNNPYSFSIVLADILAGLAPGAWLYTAFGPSRATLPAKALVFLVTQAIAAVAILISLDLFYQPHDITLDRSQQINNNHWFALKLVRLRAAVAVTLIPAMASVFATPLLVDLLRERVISTIGRIWPLPTTRSAAMTTPSGLSENRRM